MTGSAGPQKDMFKLEYPQSVGVFQTYDEAQKVVDHLADSQFPVENLCIVGTDLKSVERVLGRRTWGTVLWTGVQSGFTTGLVLGLVMWLFLANGNGVVLLLTALGIGIFIGVTMQALGYWMSRGKRDFTSVSQTVATRYELLSEHKFAAKARELIAAMPQSRAAAFAPPASQVSVGYSPGTYPPPGHSAGGYPPGYPAAYPAGAYPAGQQPPGGYPSGMFPSDQQPGGYPSGMFPSDQQPGSYPSGAFPSDQPPPGAFPPMAFPPPDPSQAFAPPNNPPSGGSQGVDDGRRPGQ